MCVCVAAAALGMWGALFKIYVYMGSLLSALPPRSSEPALVCSIKHALYFGALKSDLLFFNKNNNNVAKKTNKKDFEDPRGEAKISLENSARESLLAFAACAFLWGRGRLARVC